MTKVFARDSFSMHRRTLFGFTLVELIIVITILAILSVSAFLVVSQWIGKSRDSRRLSDLGTIQRALEVSLTENAKYPTPDSAVNITAGSIIIGQQGKFGDSARSATDIKTTPMDPLDNVAYTYYVATGGESFQVMGFLENSSILTFRGIEAQGPRSTVSDQENLQFSNSACTCNSNGTNSICSVAFFAFCLNYAHASEVSAADYSVRIPTVKGETLGILILSGTNQPVEELSTNVDILSTTNSYIAYIDSSFKIQGTGLQLSSLKDIVKNGYDKSLVGYRDMETIAGGQLLDLSTNGNHLILSGGITVGSVNGINSKATLFDGTNDYLFVTDTNSRLKLLQNMTISVWVNMNGGSSYRTILSKRASPSPSNYQLAIDGNGNVNHFVGSVVPTTIPILSNNWYHICMTVDGSVLKIYINGSLVYTRQGVTAPDTTGDFAIGRPGSYSPEYFPGLIDEVRLYNRSLSDAEIKNLYDNKM